MTHPVVLISSNSIAREGLSRIIEGANFAIVSSGPCVDDIDWPNSHDGILTIIDAGQTDDHAQLVEDVRRAEPRARCVVLVDKFDLEGMMQCFDQDAQGYIVKDMPCSPLIASLQLASLGERIVPSNLIDVLSRHNGSLPMMQGEEGHQLDRANLSQREMDVLCCLTAGYSNKYIARQLELSEATVKVHVKAILRKLKVDNRTQAAMWGTSRGISNSPAPAYN